VGTRIDEFLRLLEVNDLTRTRTRTRNPSLPSPSPSPNPLPNQVNELSMRKAAAYATQVSTTFSLLTIGLTARSTEMV
jgi:hypothetical protein